MVPTWLLELKDWVQVLTPVVGALIIVFWNPIRNYCDNLFTKTIVEPEQHQNEQIQVLEDKIDQLIDEAEINRTIYKSLLRNDIFFECKYVIGKGFITPMELQNLDELYTAYSNLGGNGTAKRLYEEAQKLEIKND